MKSSFSTGSAVPINGKNLVRNVGGFSNVSEPAFIFLAVPNSNQKGSSGVVDVIEMVAGFPRFDTNPFQLGVQSIPAAGATIVMDYFRQ